MDFLRLRVENGQLVGEAPPGLPEGVELKLCLAEPEDEELAPEELEALNAALEAGWRSMQEGRVRPVDEVIAELRAKR